MLSRLTVELPPLATQIGTAGILKPLDDKIELNRRMSETLEAMAQALFQSWFVDFDPVRAKAKGRETGLPKEVAALFPDSLEDSELGEIPKGWGVASFADTVEILGGGTPKTSVPSYWDGDIPWFSVADAPAQSEVWVVDTQKKVSPSGVANSSARLLPIGTTIISARGTVGRLALVGVPMVMNQSCYGLRGRHDVHGYYTFFRTKELVDRLRQHAHGSVFDTITRATLAGVSVAVPSRGIVQAFEQTISPMLEHIRVGLIESRRLGELRGTLLPPFMSGQLRSAVQRLPAGR
jgi:type I restriction enzyme S subunit